MEQTGLNVDTTKQYKPLIGLTLLHITSTTQVLTLAVEDALPRQRLVTSPFGLTNNASDQPIQLRFPLLKATLNSLRAEGPSVQTLATYSRCKPKLTERRKLLKNLSQLPILVTDVRYPTSPHPFTDVLNAGLELAFVFAVKPTISAPIVMDDNAAPATQIMTAALLGYNVKRTP